MRRIITKGHDKYSATCGDCGCRFTYQREDVHENFLRGGEYVSCPHCGHACRHFGASGTRWPGDHGCMYVGHGRIPGGRLCAS